MMPDGRGRGGGRRRGWKRRTAPGELLLLGLGLVSAVAHGGPTAEEGSRAAAATDATGGGGGVDSFPADYDYADAIAGRTAEADAATRFHASAGGGGLFAGGYATAGARAGAGGYATAGAGARAGAEGPAGGDGYDKWSSQPREALPRKALRGGAKQEGDVGGRETQDRGLANVFEGRMGESFDVKDEAATAGAVDEALTEGTMATPPAWDSSLCMAHWGKPELQYEPDPNGYIVYVDGREQLGGNKYLVSDGIFMAKALGRTFVEYPVKDARVAPFGEASLGLGAYWDLSELCMYHRILDLRSFRDMMVDGTIPPESFTTIRSESNEVLLRHAIDENAMRQIFEEYQDTKVIVLQSTWKSGNFRDALQYLRPNPFYMGIVRMLLEEQKDWAAGAFVAVQWRTELSTGDLTECYQEVKAMVEEQRLSRGYGNHQVLFNIDLFGKTSGTYSASAQAAGAAVLELINQDYPFALNNHLHHFFTEIDDSGVRAFVSGLAVASSEIMIGSSLNNPATKDVPGASRCQKPYSGYITLITEWRDEILHKPEESVIRIFPFEYPPPPEVDEPEVNVHVQEDQPAEGQSAPEPIGDP